jgi:hypothetical protein
MLDSQRRREWRLDKALAPSRACIERAATQMVLFSKASTSDTVPRPPFQSVTINLHEAVAHLVACDDGLPREACVDLVIQEFEARLRLKVEGLLESEDIRELLQSTRETLNTALRLQ